MSFVRKLVGPDEKLVGVAHLHWIYGVKGLMWLGGSVLLGGGLNHLIVKYLGYSAAINPAFNGLVTLGTAVFWICLSIGFCLFLFYFIMMIATEVGLTDKRLIYKKGLIFVDVKETDLEEIKGANVDNGMLGRLLNYGTVNLDARFVTDLMLPSIADPYRFVKALNDLRTRMKEMGQQVFLNETKGEAVAAAIKNDHVQIAPRPVEPTPDLNDPQYKTLDDMEPMAMINDIADELRETSSDVESQPAPAALKPAVAKPPVKAPFSFKGKKEQPQTAPEPEPAGPTVFTRQNELREEVLDEFSQSTTATHTAH